MAPPVRYRTACDENSRHAVECKLPLECTRNYTVPVTLPTVQDSPGQFRKLPIMHTVRGRNMLSGVFSTNPQNQLSSHKNIVVEQTDDNSSIKPHSVCPACRAELNSFYRVKISAVPEIREYDPNGTFCAKLHYLRKIF